LFHACELSGLLRDPAQAAEARLRRRRFLKAWPSLAVSLVQTFLCFAHWFMYETWVSFWWPISHASLLALRIGMTVLSFAFIPASLLSFRVGTKPEIVLLTFA